MEDKGPIESLMKYFDSLPEKVQWELLDKIAEKLASESTQSEYDVDEEY